MSLVVLTWVKLKRERNERWSQSCSLSLSSEYQKTIWNEKCLSLILLILTFGRGSTPVPSSFCRGRRTATRKPRSTRKCGGDCGPNWAHSPWSPCNMAECIAKHTGKLYKCSKEQLMISEHMDRQTKIIGRASFVQKYVWSWDFIDKRRQE